MADMPVDPVPVTSSILFPTSSVTGSSHNIPTALVDMSRLGGPNPTAAALSQEQLKIVRIIALVSSGITLIASAIVLHWFFRIKRNFRRQLIMILILCDSFKSLWSFLFPAVALANWNVANTSDFCQASGFFFAFGIESADFCILFIAIHAAVSIFLPRTGPAGKSGLYRYRYTVYTIIVALPVLMAGLAFTNPSTAYVAQTTWCYLPVRPFWYRLALAWIPRYIIIFAITSMYLAIYIYVKVTFRAYRARFRTSEFDTDATQPSMLDTTRSRSHTTTDRRGSMLSMFGTFKIPGISGKTEKHAEENVGVDPVVTRIRQISEGDGHDDEIEVIGGGRPGQIIDIEKAPAELHYNDDQRRGTGGSSTYDSTSRIVGQDPMSQISATGTTESEEALRRRQYAIQRQLRFLFIYPCVYVLIWIVPLVNHSLQYSQRFAERPSFPLVCISAIAVPIQGAVDCLLFSLREKPWRLMKKQQKQSWFNWMMGRKWEEPPSGEDVNIEAMTEGQRHAYLRREREKAENEEAQRERAEKKKKAKITRKGSMTWWDTFERSNMSGDAMSRQNSGEEGPAGRADSLAVPSGTGLPVLAKPARRNSSFSSFGSLGRKRSKSTSEMWRTFSFSDVAGASRKQSSSGSPPELNIGPGQIAAIEEEQSPVTRRVDVASERSPSDGSPSDTSTTPLVPEHEDGLVMKGLPVLPRK
ncbi:hypothetical protein TWF694_001367 [Orbilia ellipsospora]|uniref:Uncharacterized protein n=1 Tax=Orbilia ellipsospora TaxID=2528407 RepID=A0AAV9XRU7_9PEZI